MESRWTGQGDYDEAGCHRIDTYNWDCVTTSPGARRRGGRQEFTVLYTIPFTSERKRMTIVVKMPGGNVRAICKGTRIGVNARTHA